MAHKLDLSQVQFPDVMSISEAAIYTQSSDMRIRTLIRKGTLTAEKTEAGYRVKKADLDNLKANPPARGGGGNVQREGKAYVIHVKYVDLPEVRDFLAAKGIEMDFRYKTKAKGAKSAEAEPVEEYETEEG